jgi:hypothetical protein
MLPKWFRTACRVLGDSRLETLTIHRGRQALGAHELDDKPSALLANILAPDMPFAPVNVEMRFERSRYDR